MNTNKCKEFIYCEPKDIIKETYTEKEVTYVYPAIYINKEYVHYVPRHVYEGKATIEIINPGLPIVVIMNKKKQYIVIVVEEKIVGIGCNITSSFFYFLIHHPK
ncbi:hypothetical protein [Bacillus cereus]|uniref:hypothetical protein n=1 Tax=Bacillus cereus TaxID=1396 RepID=UPI0021B29E2F|nr:hypothetical protein [Bacillus cereus]